MTARERRTHEELQADLDATERERDTLLAACEALVDRFGSHQSGRQDKFELQDAREAIAAVKQRKAA